MEVTKGVRVRTEFDKIFRQSDYTTSFKLALSGQLRLSKIRSFCWKFFLGVLPENQDLWPEAIRQSRQDYTNLHEKYYVDPYKADHLDVNVHNPLSTDSNSTWSKYFKNTELEKTIQQDVGRTYQVTITMHFFHFNNFNFFKNIKFF
jgi:TBC1 domain family protein 5